MGLAEGGITYRTYFVDGELPADYRSLYLERIRLHAFEPLTVESEEDLSHGWVPIRNLLGETFETADIYEYQYLVLSLRIDRWSLPSALLKGHVKLAEREKLAELKRDHLSRLERGEILERERIRIKRQMLPAVRVFDMAWNLDQSRLRFGSLSRPVNESFVELFEKTFDLELIPDSPYISALHCGLAEELMGNLADIEPAHFLGESDGSR